MNYSPTYSNELSNHTFSKSHQQNSWPPQPPYSPPPFSHSNQTDGSNNQDRPGSSSNHIQNDFDDNDNPWSTTSQQEANSPPECVLKS